MIDKKFIIIGGKGGVGRTTVAAALAVFLAQQGKRVLLSHACTQLGLPHLLGSPVTIDDQIRQVAPNLWAVNMNPQAALREKGLMVLRFKTVYRTVMENRLVKYFLRAIPALKEYSMLGKAWYHTTEMYEGRHKYDTVIFDGPATGHLITMLRIPQVITEIVNDGPLASDARAIMNMLQEPSQTGLWIVTLAEEMPAQEAVDLYHAAQYDLNIRPDLLIINQTYPVMFAQDSWLNEAFEQLRHQPATSTSQLAPFINAIHLLRSRREINQHYLMLLKQQIPLLQIELPYLFQVDLDRTALNQLVTVLQQKIIQVQAMASSWSR